MVPHPITGVWPEVFLSRLQFFSDYLVNNTDSDAKSPFARRSQRTCEADPALPPHLYEGTRKSVAANPEDETPFLEREYTMLRNTLQVLAVAAMFAAFTASSATAAVVASPTDLATLVDTPAEIVSGDLEFYDFDHTSTGEATDPADIMVTSVTVDGNHGLRFNGPFGSLITKDNFISFMVRVLDDGPDIGDVHVSGNPDALSNPGSSSGTVTIDGDALQLSIFDFEVGENEGTQLSDAGDLECADMLLVTIDLEGQNVTAFSEVTVTFSRCEEIPAPAALPAGLAMLGLAAARRRRKA